MLVRFIGRTEYNDHIYRRGEIADLPEEAVKARPGCFEAVGAETSAKAAGDAASDNRPQSKQMSKAAYMALLDQKGVPYRVKDSVADLARLWEQSGGNHPAIAEEA